MKKVTLTAKSHLQIAAKLKTLKDEILNGTLVTIDPSSKTIGFCIVEKGVIQSCGVVKTSEKSITKRLRALFDQIDQLPKANVVAVEMVRTGTGHHYLTWSVGVVAAGTEAQEFIEIPTSLWSKYKDSDYFKSDAMDARYIAECILAIINDT